MNLNVRQLVSLASFCNDTAKGLAISYLAGSIFVGKPFVSSVAIALQTLAGILILLYIALKLLEDGNP